MKDLEFFRNLSIGQYVDSGSRLHGFTPATKYLILLALAGLALAAPTPLGCLGAALGALAIAGAASVSPLYLLRGVRPALPVFLVAAGLQFLFGWPGDDSLVLVRLGPISATLREAWIALMVVARTASMICVLGLFTAITSEGEAARGIESAFSPFGRVGLKAHRLSLAVATAIRFVPIIALELETLAKAQASRGADFGSGRGGPIRKARAYLPLFVPVMVRALERAELLAEAMEARCYSGEGRTRPPQRKAGGVELVFRFFVAAASIGLLALDFLVFTAWIRPW